MIEYLLFGALISWGVNFALTPDQEPICYVIEENIVTPVFCKSLEVDKDAS